MQGVITAAGTVCIERLKKGKKCFNPFFIIIIIFDSKMCPKTQKIQLQKRYLDVSNSIGDGVRAFFGLLPNRKIKNFSK
jgi:hypothetical protein